MKSNTHIRCAVYTRKSSENGLEQDFNSLDAQREAGEAYIKSQKSECWSIVKKHYDDGGFSGGNTDRPALKSLISDIKNNTVDVVVVYKVDRLSRSLHDFAKLVELFDEHGVTFVSVTQSFNTKDSMGRLTLNMLLSFAQFEREVTGERIRDKIAASKKKGMWMGGAPPVGYYLENRQLHISEEEKQIARLIFDTYLQYGSVKALKQSLDAQSILSPVRVSKKGRSYGGHPFSRGALYAILKNPVYIGQIKHKDKIYEGLHKGIILHQQWDVVQKKLKENTLSRTQITQQRHILTGKLFDSDDIPYSPTFTKRHNRQYRYYISQNLLQYKDHPKGLIARLPAHEIEILVENAVRNNFTHVLSSDQHEYLRYHILKNHHKIPAESLIKKMVDKVVINTSYTTIKVSSKGLIELAQEYLNMTLPEGIMTTDEISVPYHSRRGRDGTLLIRPPDDQKIFKDLKDDELIRLAKGIIWRERHFSGETMQHIARAEGYSDAYIRHTIMKSFDTLMITNPV